MTGKNDPRRFHIRKAYLASTRPMQEIRSTDTVAFFRGLMESAASGGVEETPAGRFRSVRAREILESCYYPHVTKEVRRSLDLPRGIDPME